VSPLEQHARHPHGDPRAAALRHRFAERFGGPDLPVPVAAIVEDLLGLAIAEAPLEVSGILVPSKRRIWVNADEPLVRKRFTLAHEVGHWVCQCLAGRGAAVMCRASDLFATATRPLEREANTFAADLLMPEGAVHGFWDREPQIPALASRFVVSEQAMHWRLFALDLVDGPPR